MECSDSMLCVLLSLYQESCSIITAVHLVHWPSVVLTLFTLRLQLRQVVSVLINGNHCQLKRYSFDRGRLQNSCTNVYQRKPCDSEGKPAEMSINNYHPNILKAWRANMDLQFPITSSFARFSYSECGLCSLRSLTHMGVMRQGGNVTKFLW